MNSLYVAYTDGACSGNPGHGGWSYIIKHSEEHDDYTKERIKKDAGFVDKTTNNRMELLATINAIKFFLKISEEQSTLQLHSDSAYVVNAFNMGWLENWTCNGFRKKDGDYIANIDLWKEMIKLQQEARLDDKIIKFIKVKGHNGDVLNEMVDTLAREQIKINS